MFYFWQFEKHLWWIKLVTYKLTPIENFLRFFIKKKLRWECLAEQNRNSKFNLYSQEIIQCQGWVEASKNGGTDYDVKKLTNERPV